MLVSFKTSKMGSLDTRLIDILNDIAKLAPNSYVVGGAVRDHFLGKNAGKDLDLAVQGDGFLIAEKISGTHAVTFVPLNDCSGRVVLKSEDPVTIDVASFKGPDITTDLQMRDFTINALAVSLEDFSAGRFDRILDPTGGISDIMNTTVRICSDRSYHDDPLRILRTFRFVAGLGFNVDPHTLASIPAALPGLVSVAPERMRDEFLATLAANSSFDALSSMSDTGVLDTLFPELTPMRGCVQNEFHHLDVWRHSLEALKQLESLTRDPRSHFRGTWFVGGGISV